MSAPLSWTTQQRAVSALKGCTYNPRRMSAAGKERLLTSLRKFNLVDIPVVNADDTILSGHQRVALLTLEDRAAELIDVRVPNRMLTEEEAKEYMLVANNHAGEWDMGLLATHFTDTLQDTALGMDDLLKDLPVLELPGSEPDDVPALPEHPVSELGDVWVLGNHRLVCGDSTDADTVAKCLNGAKPHLMVTDPPYGVHHDPSWREEAGVSTMGRQATGLVVNDDRADWREVWALFPGEVAYIWHAGVQSPVVAESIASCDFELRALIVWAKDRHSFGRGHYHHHHEPCWYAVKKGGNGHWQGDRTQTTLWSIGTMHIMSKTRGSDGNAVTGHSTQKPVECMQRPIENNSQRGDAVYEPFSGSGTTIIAGEITGRRIHAIELSPTYVDLAVKRWQTYTGKEAVHEANGRTFNAMLAERQHATA